MTPLTHFLATALLTLAWFFAGAAQAQSELKLMPGPSPQAKAMECLVPPGSMDSLKLDDREGNVRDLVRVQLRFESANQAPKVDVLYANGSDASLQRIKDFVAAYRLPCWKPDLGAVTAVQEFSLNTPRHLYVREPGGSGREETAVGDTAGCVVRTPALWEGVGLPDIQLHMQMLALITFPDAVMGSPTVVVKALTASPQLRRQLKSRIEERYRSDCPAMAGRTISQVFMFSPQDRSRMVFANRGIGLVDWLKTIKAKNYEPKFLDLESMGCPFSVTVELGQPLIDNDVREVGEPDPNRLPFLKWMKSVSSGLSSALVEHLLFQKVLVDVPCGQLDLRS